MRAFFGTVDADHHVVPLARNELGIARERDPVRSATYGTSTVDPGIAISIEPS